MDGAGINPIGDVLLLLQYLRVFRRYRPAAYLGFTIKPNVYGSLAARSFGISAINNVSGLGTVFIHRTWLTVVARLLYRLAFKASAVVFFQNQADRRQFVDMHLVDQKQTALLPGSGVDLEYFRPASCAEQRSDGTWRFLMVARLLWDKGVREFVEAARIVRLAHPAAKFQLLGFLDVENRTAVDHATVAAWVREGVVEYLGQSDDVRPFMACADCVVLPSYREGTPRSLLEAAAMGTPLVATDVPGCREVVDDGVNGYLCKVRDPADLAAKLIQFILLSEPQRSAMGRSSREKAEREFSVHVVVGKYLDALAEHGAS